MYLPGTIGDLIGDLRKNMDLNQKELAEKAGISESKLSRIESSETKNINCDTVVKIAKVLNVSTDYLLGLTTIRTPKQIDIEALGLSATGGGASVLAHVQNGNLKPSLGA